MDVTTLAALVFTLAASAAIAFQFALALGAPWGAYAMGGTFPDRFPPGLRVTAVAQALAIIGLAIIALSTAGLALTSVVQQFPWLVWLPVAFSALSLGLNAASRSAGEKRLWVPVAGVMLASSLAVAVTA